MIPETMIRLHDGGGANNQGYSLHRVYGIPGDRLAVIAEMADAGDIRGERFGPGTFDWRVSLAEALRIVGDERCQSVVMVINRNSEIQWAKVVTDSPCRDFTAAKEAAMKAASEYQGRVRVARSAVTPNERLYLKEIHPETAREIVARGGYDISWERPTEVVSTEGAVLPARTRER